MAYAPLGAKGLSGRERDAHNVLLFEKSAALAKKASLYTVTRHIGILY